MELYDPAKIKGKTAAEVRAYERKYLRSYIRDQFGLEATVTNRPFGTTYQLIVTLPEETTEEQREHIEEVISDDGWTFILK
jgi:hypothetical protein